MTRTPNPWEGEPQCTDQGCWIRLQNGCNHAAAFCARFNDPTLDDLPPICREFPRLRFKPPMDRLGVNMWVYHRTQNAWACVYLIRSNEQIRAELRKVRP